MNAVLLTGEEIAYVADCFLSSHPWVANRIRDADSDSAAAKVAEVELRNAGFGHLVDVGTVCPHCGDRGDREPGRLGWYCANLSCAAFEQKFCDLDDRGWSAEGYYQGGRGITVSHTPRLGRDAGGLIPWRVVADHVRREVQPAQMAMF